MPGYGSKDGIANNAVKVYGSWFSEPGLVPPEPPKMLPLPGDLVLSGMRDRFGVMSRPLEKTMEDTPNVVYKPKYAIDVKENFDVNVNQYLYFARDYLNGKDEEGNPPDEGYDGDGDGLPDDEGGDGGVHYTENQKIHVVEDIDVNGERQDIIACFGAVRFPGYQHTPYADTMSVSSNKTNQATDNIWITYNQ